MADGVGALRLENLVNGLKGLFHLPLGRLNRAATAEEFPPPLIFVD
jgi:hypothetical protein